jgi:hypothetical protein
MEAPTLPFVIPTGAEGPAVPRTFAGNDYRQSVRDDQEAPQHKHPFL